MVLLLGRPRSGSSCLDCPRPNADAVGTAKIDAKQAARIALSDTLILLPLLVAFIIGGDINNIVMLIMTLNILREIDPSSKLSRQPIPPVGVHPLKGLEFTQQVARLDCQGSPASCGEFCYDLLLLVDDFSVPD